ncbi:transposase, partial [bacterium]|nr:transposase [bacterium]
MRLDLGFKWFGGLAVYSETPDQPFFCRFRKRLGPQRVGQLFKLIVKRSEKAGLLKSVFRFADATAVMHRKKTCERPSTPFVEKPTAHRIQQRIKEELKTR